MTYIVEVWKGGDVESEQWQHWGTHRTQAEADAQAERLGERGWFAIVTDEETLAFYAKEEV
jgi:hypothetical protein